MIAQIMAGARADSEAQILSKEPAAPKPVHAQ